ncbi:MAG TPA: SDR family NAD(P)-dependent oxidoreductase [Bradyrhizobium sp.]|nr:SDR family NAD(P)-dependent oxidoreductase [Bradyrhizobium sp.]
MTGPAVLVAGASGGIGRAIVRDLLEAGIEVLLLGRDMLRLRAVVPSQHLALAEFLAADLGDAAAVQDVGAALDRRDRLDALILTSGIYERSSDPAGLARQLTANVVGPYALVRAALPMLEKSRGDIVFVNSSQALRSSGLVGQYAASMHAMKAIADSLREEVNQSGIRVASLFLGRTAGDRQEMIYALEGRSYVPEALIQPDDVAQTVRFLLQLPRTAEVTDLSIRSAQKP